jgi:hypothetical protein
MTTTLIKKQSTAIDAVRLAQETAWKQRNSEGVTSLLRKIPFESTLT